MSELWITALAVCRNTTCEPLEQTVAVVCPGLKEDAPGLSSGLDEDGFGGCPVPSACDVLVFLLPGCKDPSMVVSDPVLLQMLRW